MLSGRVARLCDMSERAPEELTRRALREQRERFEREARQDTEQFLTTLSSGDLETRLAETDGDNSPAAVRRRRRATVTSVMGELLVTAGVGVMLFIAWQMWIGDVILGAEDNRLGAQQSQQWLEIDPPEARVPVVTEDGAVVFEPVVSARPGETQLFGNVIIPRFGDDYARGLAVGTSRAGTLDLRRFGLYEQSVMPGEVGNFSIAAHRTTYGGALRDIDKLQLGDAIIIETKEGWYLYRFRSMEYVQPNRVQVLLEVPQMPDVQTGERYLTMTSCSPLYSLAERIIAYGVFESFQPRAIGAPSWLTEQSA